MYNIRTDIIVNGDISYDGELIGKIPVPDISTKNKNILIHENDGLYVPDNTINYQGGTGISITSNLISTKISTTPGNSLTSDSTGLFVPSSSSSYTAGNGISINSNVISSKISNTSGNILTSDSTGLFVNGTNTTNLVRRKRELYYSNLNIQFTDGIEQNLIQILKSLTPTSGTLDTFFNTTSNKLNVYNFNSSLNFKLNIYGTWTTSSSNMSFAINFTNTQFNNINQVRTPTITVDTISFNTFLSVDENGNLVTNGTPITLMSHGGKFTVTNLLLIAEQIVPPSMSGVSVV
ncbi:hypothetical protein GNZ01_06390 [Escherichia coli]|uniref:Sf6-type phage tail needle knob domain-containing protein n=1 Tax=Escherichia coli TaxID=562 RepID=A0AAJ2Y3N3_ECOLX|nr:tail needle knob protein [Escherichia coli]MUM71519.1 hypothetical protein [Escherichia coli]MUM82878.1 hypothetical protein [Escherichia coli]